MRDQNSIDHTLNHLFRQESGKMVSVLVKIFGTENFEMAEDVVQDALVSALETWKFKGIPDNPRAWLYRVARNKAIDIIRKNKHSKQIDFSDPQKQLLTSEYTLSTTMNNLWKEHQIQDDFLAMMYACCHPKISPENQITFILKSLCGFSTKEVAKSFLTSEDTISKRIYRTKEFFRKNKIRPQIPSKKDITSRTGVVLNSIYLMFNEGYNSTHSDDLIREDLISQAMVLCKSLLDNERTRVPDAYGLMALMCFHTARTKGRLTSEGTLIQLSKQDRSTWSTEMIHLGNNYLYKAGNNTQPPSSYLMEAVIAYQHCAAKTYEDTNWKAILGCYDVLISISNDPVVSLNRALVILELDGPRNAMKALEEIENKKLLENYYLYHSSIGAVQEQLGENGKARVSYAKAHDLTQSKSEKQFLSEKIKSLQS